jgi:hypothetical protein
MRVGLQVSAPFSNAGFQLKAPRYRSSTAHRRCAPDTIVKIESPLGDSRRLKFMKGQQKQDGKAQMERQKKEEVRRGGSAAGDFSACASGGWRGRLAGSGALRTGNRDIC